MKAALKEQVMELTAGLNEINQLLGYHKSEIQRLEDEKKQVLSERSTTNERLRNVRMGQSVAGKGKLRVS